MTENTSIADSLPATPRAQKENARRHAIKSLQDLLPTDSAIYTVQVQRSASGMSRRLKVLAIVQYPGEAKPRIQDISNYVANATGLRWNEDNSVVVKGCGFDVGQHVAESLGNALYKDVKAIRYWRI